MAFGRRRQYGKSSSYLQDWNRLKRQFEQDDSDIFGGQAKGFRDYGTPDASAATWDPTTGLPTGLQGPPSADQAPAYQWMHNQMVEQRNAQIRQQALSTYQTGMGDAMNWANIGARSSESYRAGGFASFDSYRQRADLAAQQASGSSQLLMNSQLQQQDMMASWRAQQEADARNQEQRAARMNAYMSFVQGSSQMDAEIREQRRQQPTFGSMLGKDGRQARGYKSTGTTLF